MRHTSLSGSWSGAYRYPDPALPEVVFNAVIEESGAIFVGNTQEPSLFVAGEVVTAEIDGVRHVAHVRFTKFMDGSGGMTHSILYEGHADETLTRIDGTWTIPGVWSGTFFMTRDDAVAIASTRQAAEARD